MTLVVNTLRVFSHKENCEMRNNDYGSVVSPNEAVFSCALNMAECNSPLLMSVEGNVAFQGFAAERSTSNDETTNDVSLKVVEQNIV